MRCNLCGNDEFVDMSSRKNVQCSQCFSLERTRLLWLYLQRLPLTQHHKVLHIAPELGLYQALAKRINKENYVVADINPDRYPFVENCIKIDLSDLENQPSREFDLILHSHVLEHVPCNIAYTLFHLHRMLKDSGRHFFVVPFTPGKYEENFQDLSYAERCQRFGQYDHVRLFGRKDIGTHLGKLLRLPADIDATRDFTPEELREANIPEGCWREFQGCAVFNLGRSDMKFLP